MSEVKKKVTKKPYPCRHCDTEFATSNARDSHEGKIHKNVQGFKPKPKQIELVRYYLDPEKRPTITEACQAIDISRSTYYNWVENDDFVQWFQGAHDKAIKMTKAYMMNIAMKLALKDYRYWEGFMMMEFGFRRKIDTKGSVDLNINKGLNLKHLSDDELKKARNLVFGGSDNSDKYSKGDV